MLEQDSRYTQKITRTESNASNNADQLIQRQQTTHPPPLTNPTPPEPVTMTTDVTTPTIDEESNEDELLRYI